MECQNAIIVHFYLFYFILINVIKFQFITYDKYDKTGSLGTIHTFKNYFATVF